VVGFQSLIHGPFQLFPGRITALTVVKLVFTVHTAELPVRTAVQRQIFATLKAAVLDYIFEDVGHGTVFNKSEKTVRQFQAS
jgi:hypothetical protein